MTNKTLLTIMGGTALGAVVATGAMAQEVTLRLHQFLPAQANVPALILDPWADSIEEASGGRIAIKRFPSMQLGGSPTELMDQAIDGVVDIVWTVVGSTPGRFPSTEVFELPFMVEDARVASCAYWTMYEENMQEEFAAVTILGTWVHGPGLLHTADPVETPSDLEGMQIRGGSRLAAQLLEAVGATPVGMPVPAVSEALSRGVIDGTTIPWEVTTSLRVPELVTNHTEFEGPALYNLTFVLAMNTAVFEALPEDLQAVVMDNSGMGFSVNAGGVQSDADGPARQIAVDLGNNIITIDAATAASDWLPVVEPIYARWVADLEGRGMDGQMLIDRARELMEGDCANAGR